MEEHFNEESKVKESKKYTLWDFIIGIILGAISIYIIIASLIMPAYGAKIYARPGTVPLIVGISLFGMSIALIIKSFKENDIIFLVEKIINLTKSKEAHRFLFIIFMTIAYVFVLENTNINFIITTTLYLLLVFVYFKLRFLVSILLSIVVASSIFYFFKYVFTVPMP